MTGFALRAPWYVRERLQVDVLDPRSFRPAIQMYDGTDFVRRLLADPRDSLQPVPGDDYWSYPVPVKPDVQKARTGRRRLATHRLVTTGLRKLYQPSHNRFYLVAAEVFCDRPGLPRAGNHDDFQVGFVMRRHRTSITGERRPARRLARELMLDLGKAQDIEVDDSEPPPEDVRDLWWAEQVREQFERDHEDLIDQLRIDTEHQGWFVSPDGTGAWLDLDDPAPDGQAVEEVIPMVRLPRRPEDCDAAATRSTWFGVVATYSADHYLVKTADGTSSVPKLDDRAIYQLTCRVTVHPPRGKQHCPPKVFWGRPSEPFRLAAPMDPQGTSKRTTSIILPDLRRLAARAGEQMGPGGVQITTPPNSQLVLDPFKGIPGPGEGAIGPGGGSCTFALELLFIVAFFLFQLFRIVVVFAFQLWWMLALRFCLPPKLSLSALETFFVNGNLAGLSTQQRFDVDGQFGVDSDVLDPPPHKGTGGLMVDNLADARDSGGNKIFAADHNFVQGLLIGTDPALAVPDIPPPAESKPDDPLCPPARTR